MVHIRRINFLAATSHLLVFLDHFPSLDSVPLTPECLNPSAFPFRPLRFICSWEFCRPLWASGTSGTTAPILMLQLCVFLSSWSSTHPLPPSNRLRDSLSPSFWSSYLTLALLLPLLITETIRCWPWPGNNRTLWSQIGKYLSAIGIVSKVSWMRLLCSGQYFGCLEKNDLPVKA